MTAPIQPRVSVIMPCLNEEPSIQAAIDDTLTAFAQLGLSGEVVVVDDGSTDRSGRLAGERAAADPRVRVITHARPHGIGASFWDGIQQARGDLVVMLPGDNENDPLESLRYYQLLEHVDIVIPFVYHRSLRSFFRNAVSEIYRQIINTTFRTAFHYTNGTVLYRRSILTGLERPSSGFFFQTELLIRLVNRGYLFAEVPYGMKQRSAGRSKAIRLSSLVVVIKGYCQLVVQVYLRGGAGLRGPIERDSMTSRRAHK